MESEALRYAVLGPLHAWRSDQELDLGPAKQRAVLAVLLLNANRPVPAHQIVDAVWEDEPPANGANVVQKYIAGLRRVLDPDRSPRSPSEILTLTDAGYRLAVAEGCLDSQSFASTVREAHALRREGRAAAAATELRRALEPWHTEPLAGLAGRWFESARRRLTEGRAAAWEALGELELELGHHGQLAADLGRIIEEFPAREGLRHQLMLALYRSGRQTDALEVYRDARAYLLDEFGVDPGERLQDLHRRILGSDPTLAPPTTTMPTSTAAPPSETAPAAAPPWVASGPERPTPWGAPTNGAVPGAGLAPGAGAAEPPAPLRPHPYPAVGAAPYFGLPPAAPPPTESPLWTIWVKAGFWGAIPLFSCGLATPVAIAYLGARRRSVLIGLSAVAYATMITCFVISMISTWDDPEPPWTPWDFVGVPGLFLCPVVGGIQAAALVFNDSLRRRTRSQTDAEENARRLSRERALQILAFEPRIAQELRIGRPDLPRWFDDGGLIDVNVVPGSILAAVPGLTSEQVYYLVHDRQARGPFRSVADLLARHAHLQASTEALRALIVAEPLGDDPSPVGSRETGQLPR